MITLNPDQARHALQLFQDSLRKTFIDLLVGLPISLTKDRTVQCHVTQGPKETVGIAGVILFYFLRGKPNPPQRVTRMIGWNTKAVLLIHHLLVRIPTTPGHPGPVHRLK